MSHPLFEQHEKTLHDAVHAIRHRTYWSAYPEVPSGRIYGENARAEGQAAFEGRLRKTFEIDQPAGAGTVGEERSPYGIALDVRYPAPDLDTMLAAAQEAGARAAPKRRTQILVTLWLILAGVITADAYFFTRPPPELPPAEQEIDLRWIVAGVVDEIEAFRVEEGRLPTRAEFTDLLDEVVSYEVRGEAYVVRGQVDEILVEYDGSVLLDVWLGLDEGGSP